MHREPLAFGDLVDYFKNNGLDQFTKQFEEEGYDLEIFSELTTQDLDALKITKLGHRKKLLLKAKQLADQYLSSTVMPSPSKYL